MPNYPTHARWGRIGAVVTALAVGGGLFVQFESPLLAGGGALGAAAATFAGAIFPDVDHHRSIPRRKAVRALRLVVVVGIASLTALVFDGVVEFTDTALVDLLGDPGISAEVVAGAGTALVALLAVGMVEPTVDLVTGQHRGWTHSAPVLFVLTALLAGGVGLLTRDLSAAKQVAAVVVTGTFFLGCLVHIVLDGELR
jgi:hypothetical protein